jgi:hypothetical protein
MIYQEIYVLTKHGKFQSNYIEDIPTYKRRYYLHLMEEEAEEVKKERERLERRNKINYKKSKV